MAGAKRQQRSSRTLPAELSSVGFARRFVDESLRGSALDVDVVNLMVSELVTNVVQHAKTDVTITVTVGTKTRIGVRDGAAATRAFRQLFSNPTAMPPASSPSGRGLAVVRQLADRVGLDDAPGGGKVVWFGI